MELVVEFMGPKQMFMGPNWAYMRFVPLIVDTTNPAAPSYIQVFLSPLRAITLDGPATIDGLTGGRMC